MVRVGVSILHAEPKEPILINAAVKTKSFLRPKISANDPAISWPRILPIKAAEATDPSNSCILPDCAYWGYSSRSNRRTRLITKRSYYKS